MTNVSLSPLSLTNENQNLFFFLPFLTKVRPQKEAFLFEPTKNRALLSPFVIFLSTKKEKKLSPSSSFSVSNQINPKTISFHSSFLFQNS